MRRVACAAILVASAIPGLGQEGPQGTYADEALRNALSAASSIRWRLEDDIRHGEVGENTEETVLRELDRIDDHLRSTPLRADSDRLRRILHAGREKDSKKMTRAAAERLLWEAGALEERIVGVASLVHESAPAGLRPGDERARQKTHLHRVLARREFLRKQTDSTPTLQVFFLWLLRRIAALRGDKTGIAILILAILLSSLLTGLLAVFLWRWRRLLRPRAGVGRDRAPVRVITLADTTLYAEQAERSERAGDWSEALRMRYLSLLALLEREGLVPRDRSQTNGEYLRALAGHVAAPEVRARMEAVNRAFDRTWYGRGRCGQAEYLAFRSDADTLAAEGALGGSRERLP